MVDLKECLATTDQLRGLILLQDQLKKVADRATELERKANELEVESHRLTKWELLGRLEQVDRLTQRQPQWWKKVLTFGLAKTKHDQAVQARIKELRAQLK